jgi:hypothetical protein
MGRRYNLVGPDTSTPVTNGNLVVWDGTGNYLVKDGGAPGGSGAPTNAQYIVAASDATLSAERVATDTATITWDFGTAGQAKANVVSAPRTGVLILTIDGSGSVLTTGVKGFIRIPVACTLTSWTLLSTDAAATSGSIVIDVWKDTYANYPPTNADSITNANEPTLSSANKAEDTDITNWTTTAVSAGDVIGFNVDSVTTLTKVTLHIVLTVP